MPFQSALPAITALRAVYRAVSETHKEARISNFPATSPKRQLTIMCLDTIFACMKEANVHVLRQLQRVINKIIHMEKNLKFQFEGITLYPSEIHLLLIIDEKYATNATRMADQLGITKGAVSQTLTRLEKKGVLIKSKDPNNKNELTLEFTPLGAQAFKHYKKQTDRFAAAHNQYLETFTDREKSIIQQFLSHMEETIEGMS